MTRPTSDIPVSVVRRDASMTEPRFPIQRRSSSPAHRDAAPLEVHQWSGETRRPYVRDRYPDEDGLARQAWIVGRLVKTDEGWFLVPVSRE